MKRSAAVVTIAIFLAVSILVVLSCGPHTTLDISVTELDDGITIQDEGNVDCLVFVNSPEGEQ